MPSQSNESILNDVLIDLSRSFLQYVAESWPWVDESEQAVIDQLQVLAARQRQDAADIVRMLQQRDAVIDPGTYPTEYTDLHFISVSVLLDGLSRSQTQIDDRLADAETRLRQAGDEQAAELLQTIRQHEKDIASAVSELQRELSSAGSEAASEAASV